MKKFLFAGLFLLSGLAVGSEQIELSFNPIKDAKYIYRMEMIQNVKNNILGQNVPLKTELKAMYLMEIMDKTAHETQAQITFREVTYLLSSSMVRARYNSRNPLKNPTKMDKTFDKMFDKLIDRPFMVTIAPDGSINSVTGLDDIVEDMLHVAATDGQMAALAGATMKRQFGGAAMKNTLEQSLKIYPASTVRMGETWNSEAAMTLANVNTDFKTTYTLNAVEKDRAVIAIESDIQVSPGLGMEGKLAGTQTGTVIIDTSAGVPLTVDVSQKAGGSVVVQGINVQMELIGRIKTSLETIEVLHM
ncbi:MAG: DUF6263 family protein [Betaproteobacteria bacterium]|nr:DUF6263 family protein [Betaproteobacteria bacterium]